MRSRSGLYGGECPAAPGRQRHTVAARLIEVGFLVAFGVLLDARLVRSVLVPALTLLIDRWIWQPSRLSRPVELSDGRHVLADDKEPALQR